MLTKRERDDLKMQAITINKIIAHDREERGKRRLEDFEYYKNKYFKTLDGSKYLKMINMKSPNYGVIECLAFNPLNGTKEENDRELSKKRIYFVKHENISMPEYDEFPIRWLTEITEKEFMNELNKTFLYFMNYVKEYRK